MSDYEVLELGAIEAWREHTTADGRKGKEFLDKAIDTQYIGLSVNGFEPGQSTPFWHTHSRLEEIYLFLSGKGRMAVGEEVVEVGPGTAIRVAQDVRRAVHADEDGPGLSYVCVRAGGAELSAIGRDAARQEDPFPWA